MTREQQLEAALGDARDSVEHHATKEGCAYCAKALPRLRALLSAAPVQPGPSGWLSPELRAELVAMWRRMAKDYCGDDTEAAKVLRECADDLEKAAPNDIDFAAVQPEAAQGETEYPSSDADDVRLVQADPVTRRQVSVVAELEHGGTVTFPGYSPEGSPSPLETLLDDLAAQRERCACGHMRAAHNVDGLCAHIVPAHDGYGDTFCKCEAFRRPQ